MMKTEIIDKLKSKIKDTRGMSFLEFSLMLIILIGMIVLFIQMYGMVNAQILVSNTTKNALRRVELAGTFKYIDPNNSSKAINIYDEVVSEIKKAGSFDTTTISIMASDPANETNLIEVNSSNADSLKYQIRKPIILKISAQYNFFKLNGLVSSVPLEGGITVSSKYQGASERFFKSLDYTSVDDQNP